MSIPNFTPYFNVLMVLKREGQPDFDLSGAWSVVEYTDGNPQNCKITLTSSFGKFSTVAPIIEKFDKIFLRITDAVGNRLEDVFHVKTIKRPRKAGKNKQLILFCPHQSDNLWGRTISIVNKRVSGFEALNNIVAQLNIPQNKGVDDPDVEVPTQDTIRKVGNFLDPETSNDYIYEVVKLKTATDDIADIESQPVEGGGSFEPVYIRFKSKYDHDNPSDVDLNTVQLQAFPQGFQDDGTATNTLTNIPNVTLIHQPLNSTASPKTNILSTDSNEDPELATNLHLVGDTNSGSYPVEWTQFHGAKDVFNKVNIWVTGRNYKFGALVKQDNLTYECVIDHLSSGANQPPNGAFWIQRFFVKPAIWNFGTPYAVNDLVRRLNLSWKCIQAHTADNINEPPNSDFWVRVFYAPAVDYSPLTKANAQFWVNGLAASKYADGGSVDDNAGRVLAVDPNVIIDDADHPRTFVRQVTDDPANIPTKNKIAGVDIPDAYRVLAIDPATGEAPLAGPWGPGQVDRNGVEFGGNVVEWIDTDLDGVGEWVVLKSKVLVTDQEVFDWEEGVQWIKNACVPVVTLGIPDRAIDENNVCIFTTTQVPAPRATTWVKGAYFLVDFALLSFGVFNADAIPECAHSVAWDFDNHHIDVGNEKILDDDTDGNSGVFIKTRQRGSLSVNDKNRFYIGFNIHSLGPLTGQDDAAFLGSGAAGSDIALPTFDFNNMFRDHFGVESWFGPQSEDFLPIQKFAYWLKLVTDIGGPLSGIFNITDGDYGFGIWMADRRDNVRIIDDLNQPRKEYIFAHKADLPGKPYKGLPGVSIFLAAQEPDTTDAFDPRQFLIGGIYSRDSFEGDGRYNDIVNRFRNLVSLKITIDGYRMVKPLLVTNADVLQDKPTRNIGTQLIKRQTITSYARAKNLVLGLARIFNHERRAFKEGTSGRCDIQYGDSVYYTDSEVISDTTDGLPNTIKAVNTKNSISLSKGGVNGDGGFTNLFELVTRLFIE